jgi:hypothetical protein
MKWASRSNVVLAGWLILAPWILGYHSIVPATEDVLLGLSALIIALWSANTISDSIGSAWINASLGVWIAVAPWALRYEGVRQALGNDVIVGVLIAALAIGRATSQTSEAGVHSPMRPA